MGNGAATVTEQLVQGTDATETAAVLTDDAVLAEEFLVEEVLVEEISIDGMCGVY